jgi:hypothetical protein
MTTEMQTPVVATAKAPLLTIAELPKPEILPALYREHGAIPRRSMACNADGRELCVLGLFAKIKGIDPREIYSVLEPQLGVGVFTSIYYGFDDISQEMFPAPDRSAYEYGRACAAAVFDE